MKGYLKAITIGCALLASACNHYSDDLAALDTEMTSPAQIAAAPQDIAPAAGGTSSVNSLLAREYYAMARYENDKAFDYKAAKIYTQKAAMAAKGQQTAPARVANYDVPANAAAEMNEARKRLVTALREQNTPENAALLAKAQCRFDCWLDRAEESSDSVHAQSCKEEFEQAMAALTMLAAGNAIGVENIAFAPQSPVMNPVSAQGIDQAAAFLASPQGQGYTAIVTAYTSPSASSVDNGKLAATRALMVREELIKRGVQPTSIKPQTASAQQASGIVPVASGAAAIPSSMENIVQIHLVAPQIMPEIISQ